MEEIASPLSAFPNEHPSSVPTRPLHSSRILLFTLLAVALVGIGIFGGGMLLEKNQKKSNTQMVQKSATPTPVIIKPTPMVVTADWKTYQNTSYAYDIKYAQDTPLQEANTPQYGYTEFANGCMKVYAVPQSVLPTLPEEKNGIPWKQFDDLKSMTIGENRNCSVLTFTFDSSGKAVVERNDYTRYPSQNISGVDWYVFGVKNAASSGVDEHNVYFTEKNSTTYVMETKTGGVCPKTTKDMLLTFSFTH